MYKKLLILAAIMLSAIITFAQPSQYTPMTAQGYQFKRILCDSTLHLPSFCGVPNLRNSTAKNGALAIDTCNNKLYQWTRLNGWSIVGGTTIDTTSLSNRINTKIDSLKRSKDSVFARVNGVWKFQYKDSTGGSTPSLQAVTDIGASTTNMITASTNYATTEYNKLDVGNQVYYPFYATDGDLLYPIESYIRMGNYGGLDPEFYNGTSQAGGSYNRLTPTYLEFNDDGNSVYLRKPSGNDDHYLPVSDNTTDTLATTAEVATKLNITDTANMLINYLRKVDTASLSSRINLKLNISDTTNKWVTSVTKLNDSTIRVVKNTTTTDITLTPAATVTAATRLVTTVYNNSGSTITKGSVVYINGRHSSNLPTIALAQANTEQNSYSTFALVQDDILNNNSGTAIQAGNITNLNLPTSSYTDGQVVYLSATVAGGITTNKNSVLAPNHIVKIGTITRAHPTAGGIEIKIENGWQLDELSDVQIPAVPNDSTLLQFSRVDSLWHSVSVNNAIGTKYIKPSDTATMLTPYQRANTAVKYSDTTSLIATKTNLLSELNLSDTAAMLSPYARTNVVNAGLAGKQNTLTLTTTGTSGAATLVGSTLNIPQYSGGGGTPGGATGNVQFNSSGAFAGSNNLFWDNTNSRLGIGTASPTLDVYVEKSSAANGAVQYGIKNLTTSGEAGFYAYNNLGDVAAMSVYGSTWANAAFQRKAAFIGTAPKGFDFLLYDNTAGCDFSVSTSTSITQRMRIFGSTGNMHIGSSTTDAGFKLDVNGTARVQSTLTTAGGTISSTILSNATQILAGSNTATNSVYRATNTGASTTGQLAVDRGTTSQGDRTLHYDGVTDGLVFGAYNSNVPARTIARAGIQITNLTNTANSETGDLIFLTKSSGAAMNEKMRLTSGGGLTLTATNTAAGTTGNQTINRPSGTVNIAAAGTTITVTNSLVTTSSIVFAVIRTNDATATIKNVVPSAGSFTINLNAAATAETSIGFFVIN